MSALSYASVRSFDTLTFFVGFVGWTCVWEVYALASNSSGAFFLPSSTGFVWSTPAASAMCSSVRDSWLNLEEMRLNSLSQLLDHRKLPWMVSGPQVFPGIFIFR